jgi:hypothetical protein
MLVRTKQLDRSGGGGLPIAPEKRPDPKLPNEFCRSASPSRVRDACGPHGSEKIHARNRFPVVSKEGQPAPGPIRISPAPVSSNERWFSRKD